MLLVADRDCTAELDSKRCDKEDHGAGPFVRMLDTCLGADGEMHYNCNEPDTS